MKRLEITPEENAILKLIDDTIKEREKLRDIVENSKTLEQKKIYISTVECIQGRIEGLCKAVAVIRDSSMIAIMNEREKATRAC